MIDEVGMFLSATAMRNAPTHVANIPKAFLSLFSSANKIAYGKTYVDTKNRVEINNPNLCLFGTANPIQFYDSLDKKSLSDGLVSRILFFESSSNNPRTRRNMKNCPPPKDLIDKIRFLDTLPSNRYPDGNLDGVTSVKPYVVKMTEGALEMQYEYDDEIWNLVEKLNSQKRISVTYNRAVLTAIKLALILAISDDVYNQEPIINEKIMSMAIQIVRACNNNMHYAAEYHVWDSEYEKNMKQILHIVREHKQVTESELALHTTYLDNKNVDGILSKLLRAKLIKEEWVPIAGGTKIKKYVAVKKEHD
jgi:hypothetical protein